MDEKEIPRAKVHLYMSGEHLILQIMWGKDSLSKNLGIELDDQDLFIYFSGKKQIEKVLSFAPITTKERLDLRRGRVIGCLYPKTFFPQWIRDRHKIRAEIDQVCDRIDATCNELSRFCLRQEKLAKLAKRNSNSDTIPYMDGSALFWLSAILTAKKDFLKFYWNPEKYSNED